MIAVLAPLALILSACTTTDMATTNTTTTTQQLGTAALKIAINAKCTTELNNLPAWKTATKFIRRLTKKPIFKPKFVVVSVRKPHKNITAVDVATAAIDPAARTTIISNAVTQNHQCMCG